MKTKIAVLGWGSLVWDAGDLPLVGPWEHDGPKAQVEFRRQSNNGRVTLVLCEKSAMVNVCWAILNTSDPKTARTLLARREQVPERLTDTHIGLWELGEAPSSPQILELDKWAISRGISSVVWTNLPPKFAGVNRSASLEEIVHYLAKLDGQARVLAEEYVRRAPLQISTPIRAAIEERLGWTAN